MNTLLTSTALGLLAAWPAAGLGWSLGTLADKLTVDPAPRAWAWGVATALAPTTLLLAIGASLLPPDLAQSVQDITLDGGIATGANAVRGQVASVAQMAPDLSIALAAGLVMAATGGVLVAAIRQIAGLLRLKTIVREAAAAPPALSLALQDTARRLDCASPDTRVSAKIKQPMLAGLSKPVILLPEELIQQLDAERLLPICAHELAHLKRRDNWRLVVEGLWNGLFWMVTPQTALSARAAAVREEQCDAIALEGADAPTRHAYAETLIQALRARVAPELQPTFTGKSRRSIAMRLEAITTPQAPASVGRKAAVGVVAILIATLTAGGAMALAQKKNDRTSYSHSTVSDDDGVLIDILADEVRQVRPPQAQDQFGAPVNMAIYSGGVQLKGRLNTSATRILLNGAAPPAGFNPAKLQEGAIRKLELTTYEPESEPRMVLNIIM